ncbi:MAG: DUF523 domain-containing protein [Bacillota bacterium]|nr:DUF523 domain-containing protein [Bacillota bacterium]
MYLVSACLLGENCKYSGGNNRSPAVEEFLKGREYMALCPEELGGFPTPRPPCEIREGRVFRPDGEDVTEGFRRGAEEAWKLVRRRCEETGEEIELAILKEGSPSCGCRRIYDGSFSGTKIPGQGFFAARLRENGIEVISEEEVK